MLKKVFQRLTQIKNKLLHPALGVRALVIKSSQVLLIKHTYGAEGWYTVGGGIEPKESPIHALKRELQEEVGIDLTQPPKLLGFFYNSYSQDYVALYLCEHFVEDASHRDPLEVSEKRWFSLQDLPADISPATRRRIEEYLGTREMDGMW